MWKFRRKTLSLPDPVLMKECVTDICVRVHCVTITGVRVCEWEYLILWEVEWDIGRVKEQSGSLELGRGKHMEPDLLVVKLEKRNELWKAKESTSESSNTMGENLDEENDLQYLIRSFSFRHLTSTFWKIVSCLLV